MTERKSLYCKSNPGNASFLFGVGGTTISSPHSTITLSVQRPDGIAGGEMEGMQCFWIAQIHNLGRALLPPSPNFNSRLHTIHKGEKIGLTKVAVEILLHSGMNDQKLHLREFRWFFLKKREENESHQALVYFWDAVANSCINSILGIHSFAFYLLWKEKTQSRINKKC